MALIQLATDDFNRANGSIGSNWTDTVDEGATPSISSNQVVSDGGDAGAFWNANAFTADQYGQITITENSGNFCGIILRANASDYVIFQQLGASEVAIYWRNGGAFDNIALASYAVQDGDVLRGEAEGTTFRLYVNGDLKCSGTNASAPSTGAVGFIVSGTGIVDNWIGGNIGTVAATPPRMGFINFQNPGIA